jgi:hypothetical protein
MEIQLIQLYLLVCHVYDTRSNNCFQRLSNNSKPTFTDQEVVTIYFFGHLNGQFEKKAIHKFILDYWRAFFPNLPSYQTFVARVNNLEQTFQTIGGYLQEILQQKMEPEIDHLIDSLPVMLAKGCNAYTARVARDLASIGYCASKKIYFHGVRLHTIAQRRSGTIPLPCQIWVREGSCHDQRSVREQQISLPTTSVIGDMAFLDPEFSLHLKAQHTRLYTPIKKPKAEELTDSQKYYNRLVSRLRQPIESFFNWLIQKTDIQRASKVRSTDALMIHCFGKLTFACLLFVFYS